MSVYWRRGQARGKKKARLIKNNTDENSRGRKANSWVHGSHGRLSDLQKKSEVDGKRMSKTYVPYHMETE